jgi:hypothetical protein
MQRLTSCFFFEVMPVERTLLSEVMLIPGNTCHVENEYTIRKPIWISLFWKYMLPLIQFHYSNNLTLQPYYITAI